MWIIDTKEDRERRDAAQMDQFWRSVEEARRKAEARERFIEATTCPHCGRHDPLPPSLL